MNIICVDQNAISLEKTVLFCQALSPVNVVKGFSEGGKALDWIQEQSVDLAILEMDLPDTDGLSLAKNMQDVQPDIEVIFLTEQSESAYDAFKVHPSGYLLKAEMQERLEPEILYAASRMQKEKASGISDEKKVVVRTFGNFDITVNGEPVHFKRAKSKELLAYLIDRQGAGVSRAEAFAVLWEDRLYDYPMQKQLDVIIRSLHSTLKEYGIEYIFQLKNRVLRVNTDLFKCDLYRYLKGDPEAVASFRGDYMQNYYWASITEAYINIYNKDKLSS